MWSSFIRGFSLHLNSSILTIVVDLNVRFAGNTTTYEWRTGRVPDVVAELNASSPVTVEAASDDQIDFGDPTADEATSLASTSQSNGDFVHLDQIDFGAEADDNISWDISVQDDGSGNNAAGNGASSGEFSSKRRSRHSPR